MRNIAMIVSYDGTSYDGFQSQPSGNTVQDKLEAAVMQLTGERVNIYGSGRTDAGVHARGQVINFHTDSRIPEERWCLAINSRLPDDIVVTRAFAVPDDFHARKCARRKTYRYTIQNSMFPDVMNRLYALHVYRPLAIEAMQEAASYLVGEHDFTSYCSPKAAGDNRIRTIYRAAVSSEPSATGSGRIITIEVTGNGFLYNMVRIIVGTLLLVGQEQLPPEEVRRILEAKDRSKAGPTAPAHGLMLWNVEYDDFHS